MVDCFTCYSVQWAKHVSPKIRCQRPNPQYLRIGLSGDRAFEEVIKLKWGPLSNQSGHLRKYPVCGIMLWQPLQINGPGSLAFIGIWGYLTLVLIQTLPVFLDLWCRDCSVIVFSSALDGQLPGPSTIFLPFPTCSVFCFICSLFSVLSPQLQWSSSRQSFWCSYHGSCSPSQV